MKESNEQAETKPCTIHDVGSHVKNADKELTCIDCIYCEKEKDVTSGYICEKNGCEIDDPNVDYCDTYFVWRK